MRTLPMLFMLCSLCLSPFATPAVIHIPSDQPTIQAGIDAAVEGDTVLVADGTWDGPGNREIDFLGKAIIVSSENGPSACKIISNFDTRVVHFRSGEDARSVLEGFHIEGRNGGAIHCENGSSPTIQNNLLFACSADYGAGIRISGSSPRIIGNRIESCSVGEHGGGIHCDGGSPVIAGNILVENDAVWKGGGIVCLGEFAPVITGNLIVDNVCVFGPGGGIVVGDRSKAAISRNTIRGNSAGGDHNGGGGGIAVHFASPVIAWNTIEANFTHVSGGAIAINCYGNEIPVITNCLIINNSANQWGGGVYCRSIPILSISHTTLVGNICGDGAGIYLKMGTPASVTNSIIRENDIVLYTGATIDISYSNVQFGWEGIGNIDADPLFVAGEHGGYYLSQVDAGDPADSPCLDAGDPADAPEWGFTRTDHVHDTGPVDMGFHVPGAERLVLGPGPGGQNPSSVSIAFPADRMIHENRFTAYGSAGYGVNVACARFDREGIDTLLTGAGPGEINGPHVRGFTANGTPAIGLNFFAYGTNKYGVNVAAGDLNGDGFDEIITGAGPGAVFGPHVRAWDYDGTTVTPNSEVSYFAYGTPKWGVNVSAGDIDGDGNDEIVTGAGPGAVYGPHVRGWDVDGGAATAIHDVSYFAYGTLKYGVNVSCGDVDGDGIDEIVTGAGPGAVFGPHVRGWDYDGDAVAPLPGMSFFAWQTAPLKFGVKVFAGADLNDDGRDELVAGRGPDPTADTEVKVFTYDGAAVSEWMSLEAFSGCTHGTNVAAGRF